MATSNADMQKILLIGDISGAFLHAGALREFPCEVYRGVLDGIDAAAKDDFRAIAVAMSNLSSTLSTVLKTLRQVNAKAKILLLAQMYEEPLAIDLVGSKANGVSLADDYLICPVEAEGLLAAVASPTARHAVKHPVTAAPEAATQRRIRQLEKLATEDDLTGLKNRRYIWEFSRQILDHAKNQARRVTLLLFDVDNLKSYNDSYGHLAGDEILKQAAVLMRRCCRQHDVVGRMGGDEFAVVFWDGPQPEPAGPQTERRSAMAEHPKEAIFIAKRFQSELKKAKLPLLGPRGKGVLTISGGLASFPRDGSTAEELFQQADQALLEAKRSGKNKIYLVGKPESDIADIQ
ncbi:MAG: diguanylate cyclase [Planctomycetota bacterium]|jgi:diguanylate cyclase (GGDEF)-like protein